MNRLFSRERWGVSIISVMTLCRTEAAEPMQKVDPLPLRGLKEVYHSQVKLQGGFWGPRLKTQHEVTLPHALNQLEKDGHVTNFDKAAGVTNGPASGHHAFDSDLYKALEGAVDSLQHNSDPAFRQRVDTIIDRILVAQQKDGFLITCHILNGLDKRWDDLRLGHQMYNAGHFFEMAVEHQRLTGDPKALDAAKRFADHIDSVFGPNKRYDVDGHQEVELALIRLYRATGEKRYLDLARFFLDERGYVHGTEHKLFDPKTAIAPVKPAGELTGEKRREFWHAQLRLRNGRMQDHKPVIDQFEAVGHAVRAGYMYSAMADMVRFSEAPGYEMALCHLWTDVVYRKLYITGGIGSGQYGDEGFGDPYLLPNASAYCESCAAIAHVFWQHRMALLKGQAKYADVMELALYNGVLSGISISGDKFFYENPLSSKGGQSRRPWIGLSCCPSNLARLIPQVGGLAYGVGEDLAIVNLYMAGEVSLKLNNGANIKLVQQTQYPWEGRVGLTVSPEKAVTFDLCLRIPRWARGCPVPSDLYRFADTKPLQTKLTINGESVDATPRADGYVHIKREWKSGDRIELELPMPIQRVYSHDKVKENQGKVALMRGPIVYCIEAVDNPGADLLSLALSPKTELHAEHRAELLGGVTVVKSQALIAVPCYAWANREKGAMTVWIREKK